MADPITLEEINEKCRYCRHDNTPHTPDSTEPEIFYCTFCGGACGRTRLLGKYVFSDEPFGREQDPDFDDQFDYKYRFGF